MRVMALQYDIAWEDRAANVATVRRLAAQVAPPPGSLLVLPEMAFTGFSMRVERVADGAAGESETALIALAQEWRSWVIGGVVTRAEDGRGRNEAVVVSPTGEVAGRYAKMHPFSHGGEDRHYAPGDEPVIVTLDSGGLRVAPFVCYDLRFPEVMRTAARRGAEVFVVIANWLEARHEHWPLLLRARAIENQVWVIGVNRVGRDPRQAYRGGSCIVDPAGQVVAQADEREAIVAAELDRKTVTQVRRAFPVLPDLRPDWTRA